MKQTASNAMVIVLEVSASCLHWQVFEGIVVENSLQTSYKSLKNTNFERWDERLNFRKETRSESERKDRCELNSELIDSFEIESSVIVG
jgi:hypothetical protein